MAKDDAAPNAAPDTTQPAAAAESQTSEATAAETTKQRKSTKRASKGRAAVQRADAGSKKPNVKLAAQAEPLGAGDVTVGMESIGKLPDEATQKAGWYCEFAHRLVHIYPHRFKLIVEKGN